MSVKQFKLLLDTLAASLLENVLLGKSKKLRRGVIRASKGTNRAGQHLQCHFILWIMLKYKHIKKNLDLMVFIREIIYLK